MIKSITIPPAQFEAISNELNAHFAELWQNVNTLNELETFIGRITACGLEDLAKEYIVLFHNEYFGWLENEKEKAESIEQFNNHVNPFKNENN